MLPIARILMVFFPKEDEWTNIRGRTDICNWMKGPSLCCCKFDLPVHRLCPEAVLMGRS